MLITSEPFEEAEEADEEPFKSGYESLPFQPKKPRRKLSLHKIISGIGHLLGANAGSSPVAGKKNQLNGKEEEPDQFDPEVWLKTMADKDYAPLSSHCVRALCDKMYDKRKAAAVEIEK